MEYTIICNGRAYDLPKRTLKTAEEIEKAVNIDNSNAPIKEKYRAVHKACLAIIGQEAADEILGTNKLDEMDLGELTVLFEKIADAYQAPVNAYQAERSAEALERLPINELEKISKAVASISK